ncbi:nitroreductase family protein [Teladorsagia circumcincta]|uniref:Nitroreductase family protein n=1 Tax=Teladorsagia circumcincta TaxID=45464 RepID=A0A2G9U736_TELCI|nr:nitroreductase family protein [Teladorsagia circumcincta]
MLVVGAMDTLPGKALGSFLREAYQKTFPDKRITLALEAIGRGLDMVLFSFRPSNHSGPLRFINPKTINEFMNKLPMLLDGRSSEALLNLTVSIIVIAFIAYQAMTLIVFSSKKEVQEAADVGEITQRTLQRDKACGEDSCFVDLHDYLFAGKEIHYHMPFMHEREMLRTSQYFYEQMRLRRSVRSFSSKAVPLKIVQNIIKTAGCAPSVGNAQPWKFCVVVDEKRKAEIRSLVEADARDNYVRRMGEGTEWVMGVSQLQETWRRPYLTDAPVLLVVCHEIFKSVGPTQVRMFHHNEISTAIAVGMMLSSIQVLLLLPLGYAAADALVPDLKRKPVEQIIKLY